MNDTGQYFETLALHGSRSTPNPHNALRFPVFSGVAFDFDSAEDMALAFQHKKPAHAYSRITNPTVENFEQRLTILENGLATIALSSGMAALTTTLLALLKRGENVIASRFIFGNTYSLLKETLSAVGIETRFVDIADFDAVQASVDAKTRLLLTETISNPQMIVPDFAKLSAFAEDFNLILAVDDTVTTPLLFKAKEFGVHLVIHSTTKYISGGATSVGGAIVDLGTYDWQQCPALARYHRFGQGAFMARLRMEVHRNVGACMAPQSAYLQTLGLETLALRVRTSCNNTLAVARFLQQRPEVQSVNYPGLTNSPYFELASKQFNGHFGGVVSFNLSNRESAFRFINKLQTIRRATNINDNRSLIIHPASTIFSDCSQEERDAMAISESMLRLSVGIEHIEDLLQDISQAFDS